jgi:hypothetical protein
VILPPGWKLSSEAPHGQAHDGDAVVSVKDAATSGAITFDRLIDLPAGRVEPGDQYTSWQKFVREADALIARDVLAGK